METKDAIRALRVEKGLSQEELAERVFVTRQAVSRWETGETVPNTEALKLLSEQFGVSINALLGTPQRRFCQCCGMPLEDIHPQPRAGRRAQPGLLPMVLCRREIRLRQSGSACGLLRRAHSFGGPGRGAGSRRAEAVAAHAEALAGEGVKRTLRGNPIRGAFAFSDSGQVVAKHRIASRIFRATPHK